MWKRAEIHPGFSCPGEISLGASGPQGIWPRGSKEKPLDANALCPRQRLETTLPA